MKGIEEMYKAMKSERLRNLKLITDFDGIKTGKIPSVPSLITRIENCSSWEDLKKVVPVLREIRFLGSPKRTEISATLLKKISEIYASNEEDAANLVGILSELLEFDEMNPLILPESVSEELDEPLKAILYTAQDILNNK